MGVRHHVERKVVSEVEATGALESRQSSAGIADEAHDGDPVIGAAPDRYRPAVEAWVRACRQR